MRLWTASIAPLGASYADLASGCPLFPPTTHQESRIHADGGRLACARHWSDYGGIQRDLCRADQPLSLPLSGPDRTLDDNEQSGFVGLGQSEWSPDSAIAAVACGRECAGHGFPIADFDVARPAGECPRDHSHLERFRRSGCAPVLGRGLVPSDAIDGQDPQPVVVLSYKFWQKQFFSNPDVLGKTLQLDRKNYQIVGVAAPRFTWYIADVYLPLKLTQDPGKMYVVDLLLKRGVTYHAADAALQPVLEQFAKDMPKHFPELFKVKVEGPNEWVVSSISGTLYLLFGAVTLLLAIGCGNVSILLLARGAVRQHELAVRAAVGAPRSRIVRQLLTESLLLAAIGAGLGVLASYGILTGIRVLLPPYAFAPEVVIRINIPVLLFSIGVGLATGVLFGLWPALQLSRTPAGQLMGSNVRRFTGSVAGRRANGVLIAGQVALTLLLLA